MEDKTRALVVTGAVLLLILALIIAAIFYLIRFIQNRQAGTSATNTQNSINFSPEPAVDGATQNSGTTNSGTATQGDTKAFNGTGYQINYPKNWGLLTCSNSQNIELDPYNSTDQLKVACDYAQKPITVIVGAQCEGTATQIGGLQVVKSSKNLSQGKENAWCVKTGGLNLLITNRVSGNAVRGYGKDDQSQAIEQLISRIRVGNAS